MKLKIDMSRENLLIQLKNFALVLLGTLVLAFGCAIFVIPFSIVTGGVTGISIIITNIFVSLKDQIDIVIGIITWGLFFLGLLILGWDFAIKTLVSTIVYPLAISIFMKLVDPDVLDGVFHLASSPHADIALIISALFGGLCVGTGCALTFLGGGSTGGVDILAFVFCKYVKKWKSSTIIFVIDALTVLCGLFVIKDLIITFLGVISAWIAAMVIDKIFIGSEKAFTAQIVSDKYEEINLAIRNDIHRTTTMFVASGGYSREDKTVLSVTFAMREYADLMNVIKRIDPTAFVSISQAHEINGEGFTYGQHD
ncbi:MAG: YitT family protein [Clostridia bacterium]|nr:YitT family protein [Clostridia bacterium]